MTGAGGRKLPSTSCRVPFVPTKSASFVCAVNVYKRLYLQDNHMLRQCLCADTRCCILGSDLPPPMFHVRTYCSRCAMHKTPGQHISPVKTSCQDAEGTLPSATQLPREGLGGGSLTCHCSPVRSLTGSAEAHPPQASALCTPACTSQTWFWHPGASPSACITPESPAVLGLSS